MKIWAYVIVWNEELMLPYYLRHYSQFCDRIIVYDNMSTDASKSIIERFKDRVEIEVIPFETNGEFNDYTHIELKKKSLSHAKGKADYVILGDCDEFVYHPDIRTFLENNTQYSVFYPAGFQMVSNSFPRQMEGQLHEYVSYGEPNVWYVKPMIVNLNIIEDLEWVEGCHEIELGIELGEFYHPVPKDIRPLGEYNGHAWGRWQKMFEVLDTFNDIPLKMLHFKFLGKDYVQERYSQYANKMSQKNIQNAVGMQYQQSIESNNIQDQIDAIKENSIKVKIS